ncbi:hypothetical protein ACIBSW_18695 [Actinoplanes sp. NPDC049668]|uniref:hypothetical protein n=1 Tax=unclassified Actinoplanes TaxID=2626549 RepID=UPI0033B4D36D
MTAVASKQVPDRPEPDPRPGVVKAGLLAAGSFATATGTLVAVAGEWGTPDATVRYAITVAGVITAMALVIAAVYIWPRK